MQATSRNSRSKIPAVQLLFYTTVLLSFFALTWWLRRFPFYPYHLVYSLLQIASAVLAFNFAASALVRFRGTGDRSVLVLAFAFALSGAVIMGPSVALFRQADFAAMEPLKTPVIWWLSRTLLSLLMLVALTAYRGLPPVRHPGREIAGSLFLVALFSYLSAVIYERLPFDFMVFPGTIFPRPLNLLTAALFCVAAIGFGRQVKRSDTAFDRGMGIFAWLSVACHLAAAQSARLHDGAFAASQILMVTAYAVALGGALIDNARLFDRVHELASSDPLTGLGNYRCLLDVLEIEVQRYSRTGRPFAVVLLDLDDLKRINDRYGHLKGSEALVRLAKILSGNCRSVDTAARYGGDEFALVLPETDERAAREVATRICERLAADTDGPRLSVSVGLAIYPHGGAKIENLLAGADEALYAMKAQRKNKTIQAQPPASGWLFER
jgi:diguanylate cyclase (GGDEF)-like protein